MVEPDHVFQDLSNLNYCSWSEEVPLREFGWNSIQSELLEHLLCAHGVYMR